MILRILANTPPWVWGLLAALLALGISQMFARSASLPRVILLPAAMTGLALYGIFSLFGANPAALLAWCATAALAVPAVLRQPLPAGTRYDVAARRFVLPGSALPLLLILGIFLTKYVVGVTLAMEPALGGMRCSRRRCPRCMAHSAASSSAAPCGCGALRSGPVLRWPARSVRRRAGSATCPAAGHRA